MVTLALIRDATQISLSLADEGDGFDHTVFQRMDPARAFDLHGPGIARVNLVSFDELAYLGWGNRVCTCVRLADLVSDGLN